MPIHGEYRMQAANARLAQESGVPAVGDRAGRERLGRRAAAGRGARSSTSVESGVTFVDGLGVGDIGDVALRDRRHMAEDGVLIVVATLASSNGTRTRRAGADRARLRRDRSRCSTRCASEAETCCASASRTTSSRSSCSRSTCTTASASSSTTARGRRPMILPVVVEV